MSPAAKRSSYSFQRPYTNPAPSAMIRTARPLLPGRTRPHLLKIVFELFQNAAIHKMATIPGLLEHAHVLGEGGQQAGHGASFSPKLAGVILIGLPALDGNQRTLGEIGEAGQVQRAQRQAQFLTADAVA